MGAERYIYSVTIYLYALSVLFFFSDFLHASKRRNWIAMGLLIGVWALQSTFLYIRFMERDFVPVLSMFDTLMFYAWVIVTFSIIVNALFRMPLFVFISNVAGFGMVAASLFVTRDTSAAISRQLVSELLFLHVSLALVAYAFFLFSFLLSLLYLTLNYMLKKKRWNKLVLRAPSLSKIEPLIYGSSVIGVPLLLSSLILGIIWAHQQTVAGFWLDVKTWTSFLVLFVYAYYVFRRTVSNWSGKPLALSNAIAFSTVILNTFISNFGISFHRW